MDKGARRRLILAGACTLTVATASVAVADVACPGGLCDGTTASETLTGTPETDYIYADDGNDTLIGRGEFDDLRGEAGDDILDGGRASDQYNFYEDAWGNDRIVADPGDGSDSLIFFVATSLEIELQASAGAQEVVGGAETINIDKDAKFKLVQSGEGADRIYGTSRGEQIGSADDDDLIVGRAGDDILVSDIDAFGDVGDDEIRAGAGKDEIFSGDGSDTILVRDGEKDEVDCGDGTDTVAESDAKDVIAANCETVER